MSTFYTDDTITLHHGDCLDILAAIPDASIGAVVTDPPYGLANTDPQHVADTIVRWVNGDRDYLPGGAGFMGKAWDAFVPPVAVWDECLRVLKPGGHVLAFAGSRTVDLMTLGLRLAGFDIRDSIAWLYGSGFPKSLDVSKAIDKAAGAEREVIRERYTVKRIKPGATVVAEGAWGKQDVDYTATDTAPATDAAHEWQGWGTALKPAFEPIVVARKPIDGTVAANVLAHGTGALNIDGCRIGTEGGTREVPNSSTGKVRPSTNFAMQAAETVAVGGRWPTNVALDDTQAAALDEQSGERTSGSRKEGTYRGLGYMGSDDSDYPPIEGDTGGASRFFPTFRHDPEEYPCSISSDATSTDTSGSIDPAPSEAGASSSAGPAERLTSTRFRYAAKAPASERPRVDGIAHPTVKPLDLMRWLVRLVTPPGGTVLEPFAGSGTTVEACIVEGFHCIAIEREAEYLPLILARINRRTNPVEAIRQAGEDLGLFDLDFGEGA